MNVVAGFALEKMGFQPLSEVTNARFPFQLFAAVRARARADATWLHSVFSTHK
jgi:hypothetical protein